MVEQNNDSRDTSGSESLPQPADDRVLREESGYKVVAVYPSGREDHRPLSIHSHTPEGLREAVEHATRLATDYSLAYQLDNRYQVDDADFDPVVYEFHTQLREICRPTATIENVEPYPPEDIASSISRLARFPVDALRLIPSVTKRLSAWQVDEGLLTQLQSLGAEWLNRWPLASCSWMKSRKLCREQTAVEIPECRPGCSERF